MVPWTQLARSRIWAAAETAHADPRRHYHGMAHVRALYGHAQGTFRLVHDPALDLAILAHDAVMGLPGPGASEHASARWLGDRLDLLDQVLPAHRRGDLVAQAAAHILRTIDHTPQTGPDADNRMILLDLADFTLPERTRDNFHRVVAEARAMRGLDPRDPAADGAIVAGISGYLDGLAGRLDAAMPALLPSRPDDHAAVSRILRGIDFARAMAERTMPG